MSAGRGAGGPGPAPPRGRKRPPPPPARANAPAEASRPPASALARVAVESPRQLPDGEDRRRLSESPASRSGAHSRCPGPFSVGRRECGGWRRRSRTPWTAKPRCPEGPFPRESVPSVGRCLGGCGALRVDQVGREDPRPGQRVASGVRTGRLRSGRDGFLFSQDLVVLKSGPSGPGEKPCFLYLSCEPGAGEEMVSVGLLSSARNMEVYLGEEYCGTSRGQGVCGDAGDRSVSGGLSELLCCVWTARRWPRGAEAIGREWKLPP